VTTVTTCERINQEIKYRTKRLNFENMKNISRLKINPEKRLNDGDLTQLKGGAQFRCDIYMSDYNWGTYYGYLGDTQEICDWYVDLNYPNYPNSYCANCGTY
jgi:hypothetical protein